MAEAVAASVVPLTTVAPPAVVVPAEVAVASPAEVAAPVAVAPVVAPVAVSGPVAIEVVADLFCVASRKVQTEIQLLNELKLHAETEYAAKGFTLLSFQVESVRLESTNQPDLSVKAFFHGQYGKAKQNEGIHAKVRLLLLPNAATNSSNVSSSKNSDNEAKIKASPSFPAVAPTERKTPPPDVLVTSPTEQAASSESTAPTAAASAPSVLVVPEEVKAMITPTPYDPSSFLNGADQLEQVATATFPCNVMQFVKACVADDSTLQYDYHVAQGDTDVVIGKWTDNPQLGKTRQNTYIIHMTETLGPKQSRAEETQRYHLQENKLVLETSTSMLDTPKGDTFHVESQISVSAAAGGSSCDIEIKSKPVFVKSTFLESTITKKVMASMRDHMQQWLEMARQKVGAPPQLAAQLPDKTLVIGETPNILPPASAPAVKPAESERLARRGDRLPPSSLLDELVGEAIRYRVIVALFALNTLLLLLVLAKH